MKTVMMMFLLACWMTSCVLPFGQDQTAISATQQAVEQDEEYAVYSALISARYVAGNIQQVVIHDQTGVDPFDNLDQRMEYVQNNIPELTQEMIDDFVENNKVAYPLESRFSLAVKYVLISEEQSRQIFAGQNGWDEFYKQYPNSQGEMTLSRVGFNATRDMALVYVGNQSYWLAGAGYFLLMVKENNVWKVQQETMAWIS